MVMPSEATYLHHTGYNGIQGFENRLLNDLLHLPRKQNLMKQLTYTETGMLAPSTNNPWQTHMVKNVMQIKANKYKLWLCIKLYAQNAFNSEVTWDCFPTLDSNDIKTKEKSQTPSNLLDMRFPFPGCADLRPCCHFTHSWLTSTVEWHPPAIPSQTSRTPSQPVLGADGTSLLPGRGTLALLTTA